jgi:hypothetical protein
LALPPSRRASCENLWREVAARLTLDACGYTNFSKADKGEYREHLKAMGEAHQWFRYDLDDVEEVFGLAGRGARARRQGRSRNSSTTRTCSMSQQTFSGLDRSVLTPLDIKRCGAAFPRPPPRDQHGSRGPEREVRARRASG